ncbi:MAG: alpha-amylase family glycosyl hydrolase [Actinomycetota bacterium]|nr:alpha-amylase family glycosyl hydrolase [Actinomycetota bacterium]
MSHDPGGRAPVTDRLWWRGGVLYQIYPRSFADSNGDGIGDLDGIVSRLDYLEWLGADAIWLNATMPSPNADWGYDVADYRDVHPDFGTLADLDRLVDEAGRRGVRVVLDLVPNHTSDEHPWFQESRSSRSSRRRDWYVWRDPKPDGSPPNNWRSVFGGPAWTLDERTGQCYLHNFLPQQPDLNWWSDEVRAEFDDVLRFWFERGIAGFRIDVAHGIVKDRELRDNPPASAADPPEVRERGQRFVYNLNRPEVHEVLRRWRPIADEQRPQRALIGETWVLELARLVEFYGSGEDELHLAFNFPFLLAPFEADALRAVVEETEAALPELAWPAWTLSNHDVVRFPTRWCGGDERKARCALLVLLCLRGTPVLYYGDELGLPQVEVPPPMRQDVFGRDGARTPMQWSERPGGGFSEPRATPWLPLGDTRWNVAAERGDPGSVLALCRDLIQLRRRERDLVDAGYARIETPPGAWAWRRGARVAVAVNLSDDEAQVEGVEGRVALATDRARDGERLDGSLRLAAWQGAVVTAE